jgi:hypothetical protein
MSDKLLHIYINDHIAGSIVCRELAKRCLSNNRGTPLGNWLEDLLIQLDEDRASLESVLEAVGGVRSRVKPVLGWMAEKVGRFKLNGRVRGYSDLSRLEELEGLCVWIEAKRAMWVALNHLQNDEARIDGFDFGPLIQRATEQREGLEDFRIDAAGRALS